MELWVNQDSPFYWLKSRACFQLYCRQRPKAVFLCKYCPSLGFESKAAQFGLFITLLLWQDYFHCQLTRQWLVEIRSLEVSKSWYPVPWPILLQLEMSKCQERQFNHLFELWCRLAIRIMTPMVLRQLAKLWQDPKLPSRLFADLWVEESEWRCEQCP